MTKSCCRIDDQHQTPRVNLLKVFAESLLIVLLPLELVMSLSKDAAEALTPPSLIPH
jgi:hypothetical protein